METGKTKFSLPLLCYRHTPTRSVFFVSTIHLEGKQWKMWEVD